MPPIRLNRFLAQAGLGSRRAVETLILQGLIAVNGQITRSLATQIHPTDTVTYRGRPLTPARPIYAILHKPKGYTCTASPQHAEKTIYQLLPRHWPRTFYVGRLDKQSEGLLLITNDGAWAHTLTHPRYKIPKIYHVTLDRPYDPTHTKKLTHGFPIPGGYAQCQHVQPLSPRTLRITLTQGLNRQIRHMLYRLGYEVERLIRVQFGPITLKGLPKGHYRLLTPKEIHALSKAPEKNPTKKLDATPPPNNIPSPHPKTTPNN